MPFLAAIPAAVAGAAGTIGTIGSAVGGIAGAIGGAQGDTKGSSSQLLLGQEGAQEGQGREAAQQGLAGFKDLINQGPGAQDVTAGLGAQRDLASQLQQYSQQGAIPSAEDIQQQNQLAGQLFAGRRQAITGAFAEQSQQAAQQAALMGRNPLDPVLRNKLAQQQTQQLNQLSADQGSFATQQALQQPQQRLGFAQQRAQILGGLATQALSNRQALAQLGSQLQQQQQNFRLSAAGKQSTETSGGGLQGALTGAIGGIGAGAGLGKIAQGFGGMQPQQNTVDLVKANFGNIGGRLA